MISQGFFLLNLACVLIVGTVTSFTDLRKGIISNKIVFPAMAAAFLLNFLNAGNWAAFLLNGAFAFLFGFALWLARFWSAGDAKLFLAFALLLPLSVYPNQLSLFPSFSILVNSFVPAFLLLMALALLKTTAKQKKEALLRAFEPKTAASAAVLFFCFYWLLSSIFYLLGFAPDAFTTAILLFAVVGAVDALLPRKMFMPLFSIIALLLLAMHFSESTQPLFVARFALWLGAFLFVVCFVLVLGFSAFGKKTRLRDLRKGMALLENVVEEDGILQKQEAFYPSLVNIFWGARHPRFIAEGMPLTAAQIKRLLKKRAAKKANFSELAVQETLPFAVILFAGTLITISLLLIPAGNTSGLLFFNGLAFDNTVSGAAVSFPDADDLRLSDYLTLDYPEFLQPVPAATVDARIESVAENGISEKELEQLWKLLWIKKDFHGGNYLSESQRRALVEKTAWAKANDLEAAYTQLNILKYLLGINDLMSLDGFGAGLGASVRENICMKMQALENEVDPQDSCDIGHFIEAKFFCGQQPEKNDFEAAEAAISQNLGDCVQHCKEHCFADVPVYVNDCSKAKNENERYHCLFFTL